MIVEKYLETCWDVKYYIIQNRGFNACFKLLRTITCTDKKTMNKVIRELKEEVIPSGEKNGFSYSNIIIEGPYQRVRERVLDVDSIIIKLNQSGYKIIKEE